MSGPHFPSPSEDWWLEFEWYILCIIKNCLSCQFWWNYNLLKNSSKLDDFSLIFFFSLIKYQKPIRQWSFLNLHSIDFWVLKIKWRHDDNINNYLDHAASIHKKYVQHFETYSKVVTMATNIYFVQGEECILCFWFFTTFKVSFNNLRLIFEGRQKFWQQNSSGDTK